SSDVCSSDLSAEVGNPPEAGAELKLLRPPPRAVERRQGASIREPEDVGLVRVEGAGDRYPHFWFCGEDAARACHKDCRDGSARKKHGTEQSALRPDRKSVV